MHVKCLGDFYLLYTFIITSEGGGRQKKVTWENAHNYFSKVFSLIIEMKVDWNSVLLCSSDNNCVCVCIIEIL